MKNLRIKLALLALIVLAALAFVYVQGRGSMKDEQILRHQIIAEDIFDQIETTAAIFVGTEEQRPFNHYRYYFIPPDQVRGSVVLCRSPLADVPSAGPIKSYFHITPEGELQSPHKPLSAQLAKELGDTVESAIITDAMRNNRTYCVPFVGNVAKQAPQIQESNNASVVVPVNSIDVNQSQNDNPYLAAKGNNRDKFNNKAHDNKSQQFISSGSYGRLMSSRSGANKKTAEQQKRNDVDQQLTAWNSFSNGNFPVTDIQPNASPLLMQDNANFFNTLDLSTDVNVEIDIQAMQGYRVDERSMLLYRDVVVADENYRQGAVLDLAELQVLLQSELVLSENIRSLVHLTWLEHNNDQALHLDRKNLKSYAYYRQLAAPFAHMGMAVEIQPLPFEAALGPQGLLWTVIIIAVVCVAGLLMIDRTCVLIYHYAQRRENFVSAVSHELKTPLTAIRMHAEMLRDGMVPDVETAQRYHQTIHAESERLSRLIDNVLELSRLDKNERRVQVMAGDPVPCIRDAIAMLEPHAKELGFHIDLTVPDSVSGAVPAVRYERDALVQVLLNAIDNALKFSAQSEDKRIIVSVELTGGHVSVVVRDFGPGVPHEHAAHIFDDFYRGERELTRKTKGTGIGLSLVKRLVEEMGGTVSAGNCDTGGFQLGLKLQLA